VTALIDLRKAGVSQRIIQLMLATPPAAMPTKAEAPAPGTAAVPKPPTPTAQTAAASMSAVSKATTPGPADLKTKAVKPAVRGQGHHAVEVPAYKATDTGDPAKTAAIQGFLNGTFGITLVMDDGTEFFGIPHTNKKGCILAAKLSPNIPGEVFLVTVAGDDGWWREPDADNAVVLIETLNNDNQPLWKRAVARALGRAGTPAAFDALRNAIEKGPDSTTRLVAEDGLALMGTPEVVKVLKVAAQNDPDPRVRDSAKEAVEQISAVGK